MRPPYLSPAGCLPGFFFFPSASSFAPMEVQSRRPLCGIQAALNGSSPVATTISKLGKLLAGLFLFPLRFIVHIDGGSKSPPAVRDSGEFERFESCFVRHVQSGKLLAGLFLFPLCFIVHTDGGSKPPPAVRDSGEFERFESCFVRHVWLGKLLAGLFLFLSVSSFAPMEVQSRRPLCGIQAALNGSGPVLSAMSSPANCLPGFFFFLAYAIIFPLLEVRCSL